MKIHPGIKLKERLIELNMSQSECAKRMGRPEKTVSEIVNGKTSITAKTAQDFVYVLGLPASYWNTLQADYDLDKARERLRGGEFMNFSLALEQLKKGKKIYREGWNGKGMFIYYIPANSYRAQTDIARKEFGDTVPYTAYLAMKLQDGQVMPWNAAHIDLLNNDWVVLDDPDIAA